MEPYVTNVADIPTVPNVCNQILKEVISLENVGMAHVTMQPGNISLLHRHMTFSEVYFILAGRGILSHGTKSSLVKTGDYYVLPPNTRHRLKNIGIGKLEHLVFSVLGFNPEDVELLDDDGYTTSEPEPLRVDRRVINAQDGAVVAELLRARERKTLDMSLALGYLTPGSIAKPHFHKTGEEVYLILSGDGRAHVGDMKSDIGEGSIIYIPTNTVHALENLSEDYALGVLCLSSPRYSDDDFILEEGDL